MRAVCSDCWLTEERPCVVFTYAQKSTNWRGKTGTDGNIHYRTTRISTFAKWEIWFRENHGDFTGYSYLKDISRCDIGKGVNHFEQLLCLKYTYFRPKKGLRFFFGRFFSASREIRDTYAGTKFPIYKVWWLREASQIRQIFILLCEKVV